MRRLLILCFLVFSFSIFSEHLSPITYEVVKGRFASSLLSYAHAKWLAKKYHLTFVYQPFRFSPYLQLHFDEPHRDNNFIKNYFHIKNLRSLDQLYPHFYSAKTFLSLPFFSECPFEKNNAYQQRLQFQVDWNNPEFLSHLRGLIKLKESIALVVPPGDTFSIALHVRRGEDTQLKFNGYHSKTCSPLKFPPLQYYIHALQTIIDANEDKRFFIYLFTDDQNAPALANKIQNSVGRENIQVCYREPVGKHAEAILSDFFSLMNFDCIIRSYSSFSFLAAKLGKNTIEVSPEKFLWKKDRLIITDFTVLKKNRK